VGLIVIGLLQNEILKARGDKKVLVEMMEEMIGDRFGKGRLFDQKDIYTKYCGITGLYAMPYVCNDKGSK
jgi:hypothetical protein